MDNKKLNFIETDRLLRDKHGLDLDQLNQLKREFIKDRELAEKIFKDRRDQFMKNCDKMIISSLHKTE